MIEDAAYLHTPRLGFLPVAYEGQVTESPDLDYTPFMAIGGARSVTYRSSSARSWQVKGRVPLQWAQTVLRVRVGEFGVGPYAWIPPLAQKFNALNDGFLNGTIMATDRDANGNLVQLRSDPVSLSAYQMPVPVGESVTSSAWVKSGTLTTEFLADNGGVVSTVSTVHTGTAVSRLFHTATVPAGTVRARVSVKGTDVLAGQPALSWTPELAMYLSPRACASVFFVPKSHTHGYLMNPVEDTEISFSFEVLEVS